MPIQRKDLAMTIHHDDTEFEPPHSSSPTDHVLNELQLYGYRPFQDEPDSRPLPEGDAVAGAITEIFDALASTLTAEGVTLIERRNCMELFRDQAAERFEVQTGSP
jgi:hypothetical protein